METETEFDQAFQSETVEQTSSEVELMETTNSCPLTISVGCSRNKLLRKLN